jgi:hypothetical protein
VTAQVMKTSRFTARSRQGSPRGPDHSHIVDNLQSTLPIRVAESARPRQLTGDD